MTRDALPERDGGGGKRSTERARVADSGTITAVAAIGNPTGLGTQCTKPPSVYSPGTQAVRYIAFDSFHL